MLDPLSVLMAGTSSQSLADRLAGMLPSLLVGLLPPVHEVRITARPFAGVQLCHAAMRTVHLSPLCNIPLEGISCFALLWLFILWQCPHMRKVTAIPDVNKFDEMLVTDFCRICQDGFLQLIEAYLAYLVRHVLVLFFLTERHQLQPVVTYDRFQPTTG